MAELEEIKRKKGRADSFASGVVTLSLSAVIVKIIGLVYKIPMLTLLGSEGMGYFNSAYEIYTLFCVIATAGLPVAMSVMISSSRTKGDGRVGRIFRVSALLFIILGVLGTAVMIAFALPLSRLLGSESAVYCILSIAPTVFLICLSSVYRGYFQGHGRMLQTAISQIIEAALKLILGLVFATIALRAGFNGQIVAAFATLGLTFGVAVSALYLAICKRLDRCREENILAEVSGGRENRVIFSELIRTAVPVTLSSAVISLGKIIDMTVILRRLQDIGYTSPEAFSAYGCYTTLALPLFSLAPALISSIALPLVPAVSSAVAENNSHRQAEVISNAMKLMSVVSLPISFGLALFSKEILELLFSGESEAIAVASPLLSLLGLSVTMSCMITVGNATLQAYSRASVPILSMTAGSVIKLVLAYILIGNSRINIAGAPISTFVCDIIINAVNFYFIGRLCPQKISVSKVFIKPSVAAFVSVVIARIGYMLCSSRFGETRIITLVFIAMAGLIYLPTLLILGAIDRKELSSIPIFSRLINKIEINNRSKIKKEEKICTVDLHPKKETRG